MSVWDDFGLYDNDDWAEKISTELSKDADSPPGIIPCCCSMVVIMTSGCVCGSFESEQRYLKEKKEEKKRKNQEDLKNGVSYPERLKKYGYDIVSE